MRLEIFKDDIDNVTKYVFFDNCGVIEISHIIHDNQPNRDVFCVPSHYYCNLGCKMCHLTDKNTDKPMNKIKYDRLLECLDTVMSKINKKNKMLISFMGVGEPLLNLGLLEEICDTEFNYNEYGVSVSTMIPNIHLLYEYKEVAVKYGIKTYFSIHSPIDGKRSQIIPSSKISMAQIEDYINDYYLDNINLNIHKNNSKFVFHYTLIEGVNDSSLDMLSLAQLSKNTGSRIKILSFNPIGDMNKSKKEQEWLSYFRENNISATIYNPVGRSVGSSCGAFNREYYL